MEYDSAMLDAMVTQAQFLLACLRGMGVQVTATLKGDEYHLNVAGPADLSSELASQIRALKPEILVALCEEDLIRAGLPAKGGA